MQPCHVWACLWTSILWGDLPGFPYRKIGLPCSISHKLLIHSASNFGAILVTKMGFFCLLAIIVEVFHCYFQWCSGTKVRNMLLASKMEVYMFLCSDIHNRERCSYLRVPKIGQYEAVVLTQCLRLAFEKAPKAVRSKLPAPSQQVTFQDKVLIKHLSIKK